MAECLLMGIIKKENHKYFTSLHAFFFWPMICVRVCGVVHTACTDNILTLCSGKYLTPCSSFYDSYYWNIEKCDKAAFKVSQRILNQKFTHYLVAESIAAMMQHLVKS